MLIIMYIHIYLFIYIYRRVHCKSSSSWVPIWKPRWQAQEERQLQEAQARDVPRRHEGNRIKNGGRKKVVEVLKSKDNMKNRVKLIGP